MFLLFQKKNDSNFFPEKKLETKKSIHESHKGQFLLSKSKRIREEEKNNIYTEKKHKELSIKESKKICKTLRKTKTPNEVLLVLKTNNLGLYDKIYGCNIFELLIDMNFKLARQLYIQENIDLEKCPRAIFMACQPAVKSTEPLLFLINEGADLNAKNPVSGVGTPLTNALVSGDKEKVNIILDYVVDITKHDLRGTNALYAASFRIDDVRILDSIVNLGISYDFKTLEKAVKFQNLVVVKHILKTNPELLDQIDENPYIFECIQESSPQIKKIFVDYRIYDAENQGI